MARGFDKNKLGKKNEIAVGGGEGTRQFSPILVQTHDDAVVNDVDDVEEHRVVQDCGLKQGLCVERIQSKTDGWG